MLIVYLCSLLLKKKKKQLLNFHKITLLLYKMETQKIINLLEDNDIKSQKFAKTK